MLTDEEIIKIAADTKTGEPGLHGYILPISFAREIESAVLAKAMPIPKQEPVAYIKRNESGDEIVITKSHLDSLDEGTKWIRKLWEDADPLYRAPQPAQAAAIPDNVKDIIQRLASELESEIEARHTEGMMIYPSIKSKYDADMSTVIEARALLSASTKPE